MATELAVEKCSQVIYRSTWFDSEDYCENDAGPGSEYCELHDPDRWEPDHDSIAKDRKYGGNEVDW